MKNILTRWQHMDYLIKMLGKHEKMVKVSPKLMAVMLGSVWFGFVNLYGSVEHHCKSLLLRQPTKPNP